MQDRKLHNIIEFPYLCCNCFKLIKFNILRNYLLHQDISFSRGIGAEFFKWKIFCGTAGSIFAGEADFAPINPQCSGDGELAFVLVCCS